jgi:hypothetical protein
LTATVERSPSPSFSVPSRFLVRESPDCPSLRASDEHILIVRVLRAGKDGLATPCYALLRPRVVRARETNRLPAPPLTALSPGSYNLFTFPPVTI